MFGTEICTTPRARTHASTVPMLLGPIPCPLHAIAPIALSGSVANALSRLHRQQARNWTKVQLPPDTARPGCMKRRFQPYRSPSPTFFSLVFDAADEWSWPTLHMRPRSASRASLGGDSEISSSICEVWTKSREAWPRPTCACRNHASAFRKHFESNFEGAFV